MKFLLALFISIPAFAQDCSFPVPSFKIDEHAFTGISRASYDRVNATIVQTYASHFSRIGCPLVVHDEWRDGTVNAQAWKADGKCHVAIFGGLARYMFMTENATLQVGMHEVGHHIGGWPYYTGSTMSCEGQADYFATAKGMPRAGRGSIASSLALARALAHMSGEDDPWRPGPPLEDVDYMYCPHPDAQCRLLTSDAGRLHEPRPGCWFKE